MAKRPTTTPEHARRRTRKGRVHPDVLAAYAYVERVTDTADDPHPAGPKWSGWALREAFLAGMSHARKYPLEGT